MTNIYIYIYPYCLTDIAEWTGLNIKMVHYRNACNCLHNYTLGMLVEHLHT